jgi:sulfoxide reductase catalytic subunit YedY
MGFRRRKGWEIAEREITPESSYWTRRAFLKAAGLGTLGAGALLAGWGRGRLLFGQEGGQNPIAGVTSFPTADLYPVARDPRYTVKRALTQELVAATHNNFYEFTTDKGSVWKLVGDFQPWPWTVEIAGHVGKPGRYDVEDLVRKLPLEERVYRFRCVEAWAMTVPWSGFALRKLIEMVEPTSKARFVRFVSFLRPDQAPGQKDQPWYRWPYYEGLRMDEAMNELTFVATGIYGHPLPKQHGAPLRLVVPWKYGYKGPKSPVKIEFVEKQPATFWNDAAPDEYSFLSNVNPHVPHPRWSQATEQLIGTGDRVPTRIFNGYGDFVGSMYPSEPRG